MDLQHFTQEDFELIENYLRRNLDSNDLLQFEQRLQTDTEFKLKVEEVKALLTGIETQALREQLDVFHESISKKATLQKSESTKMFSINWKQLLVAAALIIAAGSYWFLNSNSNERLYAKYFSTDPGLPTTMSNSKNYEFYEAMVNYKQGDYKTAISKWETLQQTKPDNDTLNYFIGVAHLANKNEKSAISFLEAVSKESDFPLVNDTYFYLGLAYLKTKNVDKAKVNLQNSTIENSKALLSELNN